MTNRNNTWKYMFLTVTIGCIVLLSAIVQGSEDASSTLDSPVGLWKTFGKDGKVESLVRIVERKGVLRATVTKVLAADATDGNVLCTWCEGKRKDRPIVGMTIMWGMKKDGNAWSGGWVFDPRRDLTAKCKIELQDGGKKLKVRGSLALFIGETRYWKRIR